MHFAADLAGEAVEWEKALQGWLAGSQGIRMRARCCRAHQGVKILTSHLLPGAASTADLKASGSARVSVR